MDQRLKEAMDFSNLRKVLFNAKADLRLKCEARLKYSIDGGIFDIDRTLIAFVKLLLDDGRQDVVLIDRNQNPIRIQDLKSFYDEIFSRYFEATNMYHTDYTRMRQARTIEELIDIGDK